MTLNELDLNLAWKRMVYDSRNQFVPDLLYLKDYERNLDECLKNLKLRLTADFKLQKPLTIDQPKKNFSLRPGLAIDIEDRIVYQALADFIAPKIDHQLPDFVYSYRLSDKPKKYFFKHQIDQWKLFREARRRYYVEEGYNYLLETDITAFYEHISHKKLIEILREYVADEEVLTLLEKFLLHWSHSIGISGMGLPQNSAPSHLLSNFYLKYIDDIISRETIDCKYLRFADDICIFTRKKVDAKIILKILVQKLRELHLNIQERKTKIFDKTQIEKLIDEKQDIMAAIDYGIDESSINPISFEELVKLFNETISSSDEFNKNQFNFCINRFKKIKSDYAVDHMLGKLEDAPDSAKSFMEYLNLFINDSDKIKNIISNFLANPETNIYEWQEMWFLILLLNTNNLNKSQLNLIRKISKDGNKHWAARTFAILTLGNHGDASDREYIKNQYVNETNIFIKKGILIACHKINKPERNLFYNNALKENNPELSRLIDFLKSKDIIVKICL